MSSKVHYSDRKFYFECFNYVSKDRWIGIKLERNTDDSLHVSAFSKFSATTTYCSYNYNKVIFFIIMLNPLIFTLIEVSEMCSRGRGPTVVTCLLFLLARMLPGPFVLLIYAVTRSWESIK